MKEKTSDIIFFSSVLLNGISACVIIGFYIKTGLTGLFALQLIPMTTMLLLAKYLPSQIDWEEKR